MDLPYEKQFHFHDGTAIGSLEALRDKIQGVSYQEFYRHVNAQKNDFASWIRYVLNEKELADDLEKVSSIVETVEILSDFTRPRSVTQVTTDMQDRIEQDLGIHVPLQPDRTSAFTQSPTTRQQDTSPAQEQFDVRVVEEQLHISQEQLQRQEQQAHQQTQESKTRPGSSNAASSEHMLSEADYTRLIVKDFLGGLVCGLILGLILGRVISF